MSLVKCLNIYIGAGLLESHLRANGSEIQVVIYDMQSSSVFFLIMCVCVCNKEKNKD